MASDLRSFAGRRDPVCTAVVAMLRVCSPLGSFRGIYKVCLEPVPIPMPFAAIVQRIRSFSLSIGQLTFGGFLLVLAVIMITSTASVIAIRHIDATFADLQRLQASKTRGGHRSADERIAARRPRLRDRSRRAIQPGRGLPPRSAKSSKTRLESSPSSRT
jgi:hypothetical protein